MRLSLAKQLAFRVATDGGNKAARSLKTICGVARLPL